MKRVLSILMSTVMILSLTTVLAQTGMQAFEKTREYIDGTFTDIGQSDWYYSDVVSAYCYGLAQGKSENSFDPQGQVTIAEAVTFAVRVHSIYHDKQVENITDDPWYADQIAYAEENGIIESGMFAGEYDNPASRGEMAYIFVSALPEQEYDVINNVTSLVDVAQDDPYYNEILKLFNAGIVAGNDEYGTYNPNSNIIRAEAVAILNRVADKSRRLEFTLTPMETPKPTQYPPMPPSPVDPIPSAVEQAQKNIFHIDVYNKSDNIINAGSGFFTDAEGSAVVNYHILDGGYKAVITLSGGKKHDVALLCGYDESQDIAFIKIDGDGFVPIESGAAGRVNEAVFSVGSLLEADTAIVQGRISAIDVVADDATFTRINRKIDPGRNGGIMMNNKAQVIGICTNKTDIETGHALITSSKLFDTVDLSYEQTLKHLFNSEMAYSENMEVPDFGLYFDTERTPEKKPPVWEPEKTSMEVICKYEMEKERRLECFREYEKILKEWDFELDIKVVQSKGGAYRYTKGHEEVIVEDDGVYIIVMFDLVEKPAEGTERYYPNSKNVPDYGYFTGKKLLRKVESEVSTVYYYFADDGFSRRYYRIATETEGFTYTSPDKTFRKKAESFRFAYNIYDYGLYKAEVAIIVPRADFTMP